MIKTLEISMQYLWTKFCNYSYCPISITDKKAAAEISVLLILMTFDRETMMAAKFLVKYFKISISTTGKRELKKPLQLNDIWMPDWIISSWQFYSALWRTLRFVSENNAMENAYFEKRYLAIFVQRFIRYQLQYNCSMRNA